MSRARRTPPTIFVWVGLDGELLATGPGAAALARDLQLRPADEPEAFVVPSDRLDDLRRLVELYDGQLVEPDLGGSTWT